MHLQEGLRRLGLASVKVSDVLIKKIIGEKPDAIVNHGLFFNEYDAGLPGFSDTLIITYDCFMGLHGVGRLRHSPVCFAGRVSQALGEYGSAIGYAIPIAGESALIVLEQRIAPQEVARWRCRRALKTCEWITGAFRLCGHRSFDFDGQPIKGNPIAINRYAASGRLQDDSLARCNLKHRGFLRDAFSGSQPVVTLYTMINTPADADVVISGDRVESVVSDFLDTVPNGYVENRYRLG